MSVVSKLHDLRRREHACTVEIIQTLVECYRTRAYLEQGCSSIFDFLVEELKYSNSAASRRYKATRVADRFPQVLEMLRDHRVSLSTLAQAESVLEQVRDPTELLDRLGGKSRREVDKLVAEARPAPSKPRESVRPVAVKPPPDPLFAARSEPIESRVSLRTTLTEGNFEEFERARAIISRKKPGASVEDVLNELVGFYLKSKAPKKRTKPAKPSSTRHIPRATRDEVMIRDGLRCTFVGTNGKRCTSAHNLQIDHVKPWALGGTHEAENLRVLCAAHNRHRARQTFGPHETSAISPIGTAGGNGMKTVSK